MTGADKRSLAERASEAFDRTINPPSDIEMQAVDPATLACLARAIRSLRPLEREVFVAHRFDALSYDEIAQRTELSVAEVEQAMSQALRDIVRQLKHEPRPRFWRLF